MIQARFEHQITITQQSTCRAVYFHSYLLEQTLKLLDVTLLDNTSLNMNVLMHAGKDVETVLCRQILILPKIIITKENLYTAYGKYTIL